jgi:hypothetical protein
MDKEDLNFNELLDDFRRIKSAIKQNSYIYRQLIYSPVVKLILLVSGLTALLIPVFYYLLLKCYGNYEAIPFEFRLALILALIVGFSIAIYGKLTLIIQAYHLTPPQPSFLKFISRVFSRQVLLLCPLIFGSIFFFVIFFMTGQNYHLIVPAVAIGLGLCFGMIGSFISSWEFFMIGNYCWVLGIISIPFIVSAPITALLWTSGIFRLGMLGLGFYLMFLCRASEELEIGF